MRDYWDGEAGRHWVEQGERYDEINRRFGERVVDVFAARPGERVLDIGCGNGALAIAVGRLVGDGGSVVGVDLSGPMLGEARRRAESEGLGHVRFEQADVQEHAFEPGSFDGAVSRFGVMFFEDPVAAFSNVLGALRPGGRLVFACWQELLQNEWITVPVFAALAHLPMPELGAPGAPGPFALADADRTRSILEQAGFESVEIDAVTASMRIGESVEDTLTFFRGSDLAATIMKDAPPEAVEAAMAAMGDAVRPHAGPDGVVLSGSAWLVQARSPSG
jgi:SAM-dependent methyltransferase